MCVVLSMMSVAEVVLGKLIVVSRRYWGAIPLTFLSLQSKELPTDVIPVTDQSDYSISYSYTLN